MREVESLPTYGIHYYDVRDRNDLPWYLGLSNRGISQYDYLDKRKPRKVFLWRQLENIYFRERKFSVEVLDPKRVCLSRRSLGSASASVTVHVWFADSQSLCKAIWSMAIAQHQFYLDRKTLRSEEHTLGRAMPELSVDLSRSCLSLSTHSSCSNLSHSGSHSSLHQHSQTESGSSESLEAARQEMLEALKLRRSGLQEKLADKTEELRLLCLREGELTGELPPEYPIIPGQPPPTVRKRVGTSFALDETIINRIINKQEETVSALELEYEIMAKITSAALKLANESTARKGVRRQRKLSYQQSAHRLRELELKLKQARSKAVATASTLPKQKKKPRPLSESEGVEDSGITGSLSSSAGSTQDSPRDPSFPSLLASPHNSPSLNTTLTTEGNGRRRDRSPHPPRNSAPASPHRAGSALNTTVTSSSSSSRPASPSRPARVSSLDRPRANTNVADVSRSTDQLTNSSTLSDQTLTSTSQLQTIGPHSQYHEQHLTAVPHGQHHEHHLTAVPHGQHQDSTVHSSQYSEQQQGLQHHDPHTAPSHHAPYQQEIHASQYLHQPTNSPHLPNPNHHQQQVPNDHHSSPYQQHNNNNNNNNNPRHSGSSSKLRPTTNNSNNGHPSHLPTQVHNISSSSTSSPAMPSPLAHNTTTSSISSASSGGMAGSTSHGSYQGHNSTSNGPPHHAYHHGNGTPTLNQQHQYPNSINHNHHGNNHVARGVNGNGHPHQYHRQSGVSHTPSMVHDNSRTAPHQQTYYNSPHSNAGLAQGSHKHGGGHANNINSPHTMYHGQQHAPHNYQTPPISRLQQQKEFLNDSIARSTNTSVVNTSYETRTSGEDSVDGHVSNKLYHHNQHRQSHLSQANMHQQAQNNGKSQQMNTTINKLPEVQPTAETVHTLVRTNSGRSYMETTFLGDSSSASSTTSNQENIPPPQRSQASHQVLPLRPTASHLRASSSVTPADMAPPRLLPAVDLVPLRATKSSSELPPLRATNHRGEYPSNVMNTTITNGEPLLSLAEAAKLKKDREREWYETCLDSPVSGRRAQRSAVSEVVITKVPNAPGSGASSTCSSSSAYPSPSEGYDSRGTSSTPTNGVNQSNMITTGTYQPSREVTKPFEMADFYKYSTKYRKQSLAGGGSSSNNSSFSTGSDSSAMSPLLPPRAQVVVSSSKAAPPSPAIVAQQSTPSAQQKGVYQSLAPYTCQGVVSQSSSPSTASPAAGAMQQLSSGAGAPSWDGASLHQALPATVTTKRSATLV